MPAHAQAATALPVLEERRREVTTQLGQQLGRLGHGFVASTHDLFEQVRPTRYVAFFAEWLTTPIVGYCASFLFDISRQE